MTRRDRHAKAPSDIQSWLIAQLSRQLDLPAGSIDVRRPFLDYGLSSREAIVLSGDMSDWLGEPLSPTLAYDYPTVEALAAHLANGAAEAAANGNGSALSANACGEPIAVVGIGCRFPGAPDPDAYWDLLYEGRDAVRAQPVERRNGGPPAAAGFIEGIDRFDAPFFGIAPREAASVDPQQRLVLEVAWEALEHAGIAPDCLAGTDAGVFVGISSFDFAHVQSAHERELEIYATTGSALSVAANRLSYCLDLRGPSLAIDTACSSSLVAVHQACQSLRSGECDLALAGGVNVLLDETVTAVFAKSGMLARDGRCKTFDARADGYVRGEGCGIVVLRRLSDAVKDRNDVLAVVRGSAVNHDGRSNGLTAPNGRAQEAVIRRTLLNAGVSAAEIGYVETHGTGTALGDPIEVRALRSVLMEGRPPASPCRLGSVKSNIGHLEAAAGIAGLIKVVLALRHGVIPRNLHFETLNPGIALGDVPMSVASERLAWPGVAGGRKASVSSFGFGGANAHVVLQEAPRSGRGTSAPSPAHLLVLSAKTDAALADLAQRYSTFLETHRDTDLGDLCYTAAVGRSHFHCRAAVGAATRYQLKQRLARLSGEIASRHRTARPRFDQGAQLGFLFTGDGSSHDGTGRELYETQPTFRAAVSRCLDIVAPLLPVAIADVFCPSATDAPAAHRTPYAYVASFISAYALAELWQSWRITPSAVAGRGAGEFAAACVAGVYSLEGALRRVCEQARSMDATLPRLEPQHADVAPGRVPVVPAADVGAALRMLHEHGCDVYLEIGSNADLAATAGECIPDGSARIVPGLKRFAPEWPQMIESLGILYECGAHVDWTEFYRLHAGRRVALPTYPFQRERHWPDAGSAGNGRGTHMPPASHEGDVHPLLGQRLGELAHLPKTQVWESALDVERLPFLADHQLCGRIVLPHGVYVEMALRAGEEMFGSGFSQVTELKLHEALVVSEEHGTVLQAVASIDGGEASFAVYSRGANGAASSGTASNGSVARKTWTLHATARLHAGSPAPPGP